MHWELSLQRIRMLSMAVRKDSPLIVGRGEGENLIASDVPAILKYTRDVYFY